MRFALFGFWVGILSVLDLKPGKIGILPGNCQLKTVFNARRRPPIQFQGTHTAIPFTLHGKYDTTKLKRYEKISTAKVKQPGK